MSEPAGTAPQRPPGPDPTPGERRLQRPPSDRYGPPVEEAGNDDGPPGGSATRAISFAVAVGLVGAGAYAVLAGPLGLGAGLLVVAVAVGRFVGLAALAGAGGSVGSGPAIALSIGVAIAAVVIGEAGTWLFARSEGGVLGPVDYIIQVHGPLAPLGLALAAATAGWTAR